MLVSIRLLWSGTGSPTINNLKSYTLKPHYSPFLNPIEDLFSAWRCCVYDYQHQAACLFCRQWNRRRWGKVNPWMDSAQGSISTPTHNRCVFLYLQYSIHSVFLVYFCLNLIYCTVKYSSAMYSIAYYIFWLLGKRTLWNWIKTVNMKDCSVSYKVDQCVSADLKVYSYDRSVYHFVISDILIKDCLVSIAEFQFDIDVNGIFPSVVSYLLVCWGVSQ